MRLVQIILISSLIVGQGLPAVAVTHARRGPTSPRLFKKASSKSRPQSQRGIDDERATQIQNALIRSGYYHGDPSGHWDLDTQNAMEKLQADNGWQTKLVPDSRALIKLGLGPSSASGNTLGIQQPPTLAASQPNTIAQQ